MTFKKSLSMEKKSESTSFPKPPTFEEILADLQTACVDDVAFKTPEKMKANKEELIASKQQSSDTSTDYSEKQHSLSDSHNRKKMEYTEVTDFLVHYNSLMEMTNRLKQCTEDMDNCETTLQEKINRVEQSWKEQKHI